MLELAELVLEVTGSIVRDRLRAAARGRSHAAPARHHRSPARDLGWEPTTALRDGLARTVPYFRSAIGLD